MSWTPALATEAVKEFGFFVKRLKTGRRVKISFESEEPLMVVCSPLLEKGELLQDKAGTKLRVLYPEYVTEGWPHKVYFVEIVAVKV